MNINLIVDNQKLLNILDKYSSSNKFGTILKNIARNLSSPEMIIPVLGMQGVGKSTLINGLLGENILPNEADETTCVPVEIRFGENKETIVYFLENGKKTEKVTTTQDLKEYVDNENNPGNVKGVSHIVLFRELDILKNGLVIVDLPGVGSLTKNNQDTTIRYIEKLCSAIFVLPIVPTIRRQEEMFIKSVWQTFSYAMFVQNNFGESGREVEESVSFNTSVLENISESIKVGFDKDITVINAYDAVEGSIKNDEELVKRSNIVALVEKLNETAKNRKEFEIHCFFERTKMAIDSVKMEIETLTNQANMTKSELAQKFSKSENKFQEANIEIEKFIKTIEAFLDEKKGEFRKFSKDKSYFAAETLRSDVFHLIDSGIVDGSQLTSAFSDCQNSIAMDISNELFDFMNNFAYELSISLDKLQEIIKVEKMDSVEASLFSNGQAFKFEKGLDVGLNLGGAIGGLALGTIVAEAVTGAIAGSVGGPAGIAVGFTVALAVGLISSFIGSQSKKMISEKRGTIAKSQLMPYIDDFGDKIKELINKSFEKVDNSSREMLETYILDRKNCLKHIKIENEKKLQSEYVSEYNTNELQEDMKYLCEMRTKYVNF